jgi:hypothetical protein
MNYKIAAALSLVPLVGLLVTLVALYNSMDSDRADLTIAEIGFEPYPLVAKQRELIVITVKNTGRNYAIIDAVATDRVKNKLHDSPTYEPARFTPSNIAGGGELQFVSDLGDQILSFTQAEVDSLNASTTTFKMIGFIKYTDQKHPWILGGGVVQFCYVWDPRLTTVDKFSACNEKQYTERCNGWFCPRLKIREIPMITVGTQTVSSTVVSPKYPDPNYPIQQIQTRRTKK